jgi:hypothetical protein
MKKAMSKVEETHVARGSSLKGISKIKQIIYIISMYFDFYTDRPTCV